mgnify:CR=1 FL=1
MNQAFICDAIRTPFGRYGGALSSIRTDDLGAIPIKALMERNPQVDWAAVEDIIYGCANQAGEDNRNVAHMATLLAGYPQSVSGTTINRLCGSGLDALGIAYKVSEKLVRGLDYYSNTVFEFTTDKLGAQGTVLAGGRYNDLVKLMGGNDTACIGFAAGVERLSALIEGSYKTPPSATGCGGANAGIHRDFSLATGAGAAW